MFVFAFARDFIAGHVSRQEVDLPCELARSRDGDRLPRRWSADGCLPGRSPDALARRPVGLSTPTAPCQQAAGHEYGAIGQSP